MEETNTPIENRIESTRRVFLQWGTGILTFLCGLAVGIPLVIFFGPLRSPIIHISLIAVSLWLAINGTNLIRGREPEYTIVFKRNNYFMLMVMMFIFFDKLPDFLL